MLSVVRKSLREINSGLKRALAAFGGIGLSHSTCALFGLGECLTGMLKRAAYLETPLLHLTKSSTQRPRDVVSLHKTSATTKHKVFPY